MRKLLIAVFFVSGIMVATPQAAEASTSYVEYYRDNLVLGIAYHRIGCATNWSTIQSNKDYDGFTYTRYCHSGASSSSVPAGEWYDWDYASTSELNTCNDQANWVYDTPNNKDRSNSCSYNVLTDCNSDCWIGEFSKCMGWLVETVSGCWGDPPNGPNWQ